MNSVIQNIITQKNHTNTYDTIVVGNGAVGLAAVDRFLKAGHHVLWLSKTQEAGNPLTPKDTHSATANSEANRYITDTEMHTMLQLLPYNKWVYDTYSTDRQATTQDNGGLLAFAREKYTENGIAFLEAHEAFFKKAQEDNTFINTQEKAFMRHVDKNKYGMLYYYKEVTTLLGEEPSAVSLLGVSTSVGRVFTEKEGGNKSHQFRTDIGTAIEHMQHAEHPERYTAYQRDFIKSLSDDYGLAFDIREYTQLKIRQFLRKNTAGTLSIKFGAEYEATPEYNTQREIIGLKDKTGTLYTANKGIYMAVGAYNAPENATGYQAHEVGGTQGYWMTIYGDLGQTLYDGMRKQPQQDPLAVKVHGNKLNFMLDGKAITGQVTDLNVQPTTRLNPDTGALEQGITIGGGYKYTGIYPFSASLATGSDGKDSTAIKQTDRQIQAAMANVLKQTFATFQNSSIEEMLAGKCEGLEISDRTCIRSTTPTDTQIACVVAGANAVPIITMTGHFTGGTTQAPHNAETALRTIDTITKAEKPPTSEDMQSILDTQFEAVCKEGENLQKIDFSKAKSAIKTAIIQAKDTFKAILGRYTQFLEENTPPKQHTR